MRSLLPLGRPASAGELTIGLITLRCLLLVALVPLGSAGRFAMPVATLLLSLWCLAVLAVNRRASFLSGLSLLLALGLAAYLAVQSLPVFWGVPAGAIWGEASHLLGGDLPASISVAPAQTIASIPVVVLPFLIFAATLHSLRSDAQAVALMRFMAFAGAATALFGIFQFSLFPDTILLFDKAHYKDSLTAVFVNRNTAATFLGCTLVLLMALTASILAGSPPFRTFVTLALHDEKTPRDWRLLFHFAAIFVVVLALFLTKSRAGITSTGAAVLLLALLLSGFRRSGPIEARTRILGLAKTLGIGVVAAMLALLVLGGQTIQRVQTRGIDDARFCFYGDIWRAALETWPFGTGGGTFQLAFAPYRDPACGTAGVLDKAHNFYLEGLMTMGIGFVVPCVVVYVALVAVLSRGVAERRRLRPLPASGLAVLLLVSLHDMIDFSIQIPAVSIWVAVMLATACASAFRQRPV